MVNLNSGGTYLYVKEVAPSFTKIGAPGYIWNNAYSNRKPLKMKVESWKLTLEDLFKIYFREQSRQFICESSRKYYFKIDH